MDALGTINHDYKTPRLDDTRQRSREYRRTHAYAVSECYRDKALTIRQEWRKCFTGREEYA